MAAAYKTPGVYVEEISTLPPSVAEVSTAIPAFVGYTEMAPAEKIARVSTLLEYEQVFGGPSRVTFKVTLTNGIPTAVERTGKSEYFLYHAVSHYFKNGGGACYIVSVGSYADAIAKANFAAGITKLEKEDEPTLVIVPEAIGLSVAADYYEICQASLAHCKKLGDRFAILDVKDGNVGAFREGIGTNYLNYGAAYHPYVQTTLNIAYNDSDVTLSPPVTTGATGSSTGGATGGATPAPQTLSNIQLTQTALYQQIKTMLAAERVVLPPSAAMAGIYASVDRDRGVWKAPANVSLSAVIGPTKKITEAEQGDLNVDPTAGKSINAIRAFTGKGTLVWGARTLAGNDNEWRYVSVRRLFITIEESARKATSFAVFEPNDISTWLKVKGMTESYLYGLWERGALAGSTPDAAYFVNVGLGKTMTAQDVLEGRMIVKIGIAAVRPAEFIVLQFTHKLQEA
ncbi:MAG TPA: phage tail sheath subtilisin-like domain-containing protein [Polyangium sp.]|nr:phage tail sheath subtilisin-like domain-containing protein [Polyangium sp.]